MADTLQPPVRRARNVLPVLVGTLVAIGILFILQYWVRGGPPEDVIPYEETVRPYMVRHTRAEFWGMVIGIFMGSFLASLLFLRSNLVRGLWIAVLVVATIAISPWPFALQKEIIIFALPLWMIAGLAGMYTGRLVRREKATR
jgi:hypothetical protein